MLPRDALPHAPRYDSPGYYYVCNPLTDEWITLPESGFIHGFLCALYYHPSVKEKNTGCYVTLSTGMRFLLSERRNGEVLRAYSMLLPRLFSNSMSFMALQARISLQYRCMLEIWGDVVAESCRIKEWTIHEARLIELEGKLGVSTVASDANAMLDIWMLEDYEKHVWVKRYRVQTMPESEHITWIKPDDEALMGIGMEIWFSMISNIKHAAKLSWRMTCG